MGECGEETEASFVGGGDLNTTVPVRVHKRRGVGRWVSPMKIGISCPCKRSPFVCLFVFVL